MTLIYLYGGLRKSEARCLRWSDLDLEDGWFRFKGKGGDENDIPMSSTIRGALVLWRLACPSAEWVFPGRFQDRPVSPTWVYERIHEVGRAASIYLTPHMMRHTFATAFYKSSGNIRATQKMLRHKRIETTTIYTDVWPSDLQKDMTKFRYSE